MNIFLSEGRRTSPDQYTVVLRCLITHTGNIKNVHQGTKSASFYSVISRKIVINCKTFVFSMTNCDYQIICQHYAISRDNIEPKSRFLIVMYSLIKDLIMKYIVINQRVLQMLFLILYTESISDAMINHTL